jgi:hypothetical protein
LSGESRDLIVPAARFPRNGDETHLGS